MGAEGVTIRVPQPLQRSFQVVAEPEHHAGLPEGRGAFLRDPPFERDTPPLRRENRV